MTGLGKLLVFLNLFVAVALLSWAVSLVVNRLDWIDRPDPDGGRPIEGEITKLRKEIDRTAKAVAEADVGYAVARTDLDRQEAGRAYRRFRFEERLAKAKQGEFFEQLLLGDNPDPSIPPELKARIDVDREGKAVVDLNGKALRGVEAIQADLSKEVRLSTDLSKAIADDRTKFNEASVQIKDTDARIDVQRTVLAALADEAKFLESTQINWDEELRTLSRRLTQLEKRLKALGVDPAAAKPVGPNDL